MRRPLQKMYGHVPIIANYSAINNSIQKEMNSFKFNNAEMMSANFQIYGSNIQAIRNLFVKLQTMYGNAITENVWAHCT